MQDARALGVHVCVRRVAAPVLGGGHERARRIDGIGREEGAPLPIHIQTIRIQPLGLLEPEPGEIGGKALVEPQVAPAVAGQIVSPPLVGELVGDEPLRIALEVRALVVKCGIGLCGGRDVLHPADHELLDGRLRILGPRIRGPDPFREELHHLRSLAERAARALLARPLHHEILDRHAMPIIGPALVRPDRHRDQIGGIRLIHRIAPRAGRAAGVVGDSQQYAVAHGGQILGNMQRAAPGRAIVGIVVERKPTMIALGLPLRVALQRLGFVARLGPSPVEAIGRRCLVIDRDLEFLAGLRRARQSHV